MDLPYELWLNIFTYLDVKDLSSVALCSKLFHDLASCDIVWKPILLKRFGENLKFPFSGTSLEPRAKNFFLQFHRRSISKMNSMKGLVHGLEARVQNSHFYNRSKECFRELLYWPSEKDGGMSVMCSTNLGCMTFWEFCPLKEQRDFSKVLWMKRRRPGTAQTGKECVTLPFRWRKSYSIKEDGNDIRCLKEFPNDGESDYVFVTAGMDRKLRIYKKNRSPNEEEDEGEEEEEEPKARKGQRRRGRGRRKKVRVLSSSRRSRKKKKNKDSRNQWKKSYEIRAHSGCINTLKVFKNSKNQKGTLIVTGSMDRTLKIWRINENEGEKVQTLEGHMSGITSVRISKDEEHRLVSKSMDNYLKSWDLNKEEENTRTIYVHRMTSFKFEKRHKILVSGTPGYLKIYDTREGKFVFEIDDLFSSSSFTRDRNQMDNDRVVSMHYLTNPNHFATVSSFGNLHIFDERKKKKPVSYFSLRENFSNLPTSPVSSPTTPSGGAISSYVSSSRRKSFFGVYEQFGFGYQNGGVQVLMIDPSCMEVKVNVVLNYGQASMKPSRIKFLNEYQLASLCNMILVYDFSEYSFFRRKLKRYTSFKPHKNWSNYF